MKSVEGGGAEASWPALRPAASSCCPPMSDFTAPAGRVAGRGGFRRGRSRGKEKGSCDPLPSVA